MIIYLSDLGKDYLILYMLLCVGLSHKIYRKNIAVCGKNEKEGKCGSTESFGKELYQKTPNSCYLN